jgi:cytochrome c553
MKRLLISLPVIILLAFVSMCFAADTVPSDIKQPGTQPQETSDLSSFDKCYTCHGKYNTTVEPTHNWRGSMMANAGRDPLFWAAFAIAEQDFDGAGDFCIRCHSVRGWLEGRFIPTDGSGLDAVDADGVECDFCHRLTNPDNSEHIGVQFFPYLANDFGDPVSDPSNVIGYYGSGMTSIWNEKGKLGLYTDASARHRYYQSLFHSDVDFCGTCHDVSNPAVGNLAPNSGTQSTADPVFADGTHGGPVDGKAAFNNLPYKYGIVQRTFSEYKASLLSKTLVTDYFTLPRDLRKGATEAAYENAWGAGNGGNYADGKLRYFSCQTCHMRPINAQGSNKEGVKIRKDLPLHDMTGGNYWMPDAITYLDGQGKLRLGGGLTNDQILAMNDGKTRARKQLSQAVSLSVTGNTLKVINLTGHKLVSGYPEGRRMWLNIKWYDESNNVLREDGEYGPMTVNIGGTPTQVDTILNLHDENTRIYESRYGITQDWATALLEFHPSDLALSYDRITGEPDLTLGQLAASLPGTQHETFHLVLNNTVVKDNRIPPYGMSYEEARERNVLPVPQNQYGGTPGGTYNYWDEVILDPPSGAAYATIDMLYQPTSWEYIQFLSLANNGQNTFLADQGVNMLDAWMNTGMAQPFIMATASWDSSPEPPPVVVVLDLLTTWSVDKNENLAIETGAFKPRDTVGIVARVIDYDDESFITGAQVFLMILDPDGNVEVYLQGFSDNSGTAVMKWQTDKNTAIGTHTVRVAAVIISDYWFLATASVITAQFNVQ